MRHVPLLLEKPPGSQHKLCVFPITVERESEEVSNSPKGEPFRPTSAQVGRYLTVEWYWRVGRPCSLLVAALFWEKSHAVILGLSGDFVAPPRPKAQTTPRRGVGEMVPVCRGVRCSCSGFLRHVLKTFWSEGVPKRRRGVPPSKRGWYLVFFFTGGVDAAPTSRASRHPRTRGRWHVVH